MAKDLVDDGEAPRGGDGWLSFQFYQNLLLCVWKLPYEELVLGISVFPGYSGESGGLCIGGCHCSRTGQSRVAGSQDRYALQLVNCLLHVPICGTSRDWWLQGRRSLSGRSGGSGRWLVLGPGRQLSYCGCQRLNLSSQRPDCWR